MSGFGFICLSYVRAVACVVATADTIERVGKTNSISKKNSNRYVDDQNILTARTYITAVDVVYSSWIED